MPLRNMARLLGVKPEALKAEAVAGRVPHVWIGGELLFTAQAVFDVLAKRAAHEGLRAEPQRELAHA